MATGKQLEPPLAFRKSRKTLPLDKNRVAGDKQFHLDLKIYFDVVKAFYHYLLFFRIGVLVSKCFPIGVGKHELMRLRWMNDSYLKNATI